jgi:hypothetical protein
MVGGRKGNIASEPKEPKPTKTGFGRTSKTAAAAAPPPVPPPLPEPQSAPALTPFQAIQLAEVSP